jgi:hypothetical protein
VRANLLIDDGEQLVKDLNDHRGEAQTHDERLAQYMYVEALRALGHVELMRVVTGPAKDLYRDGRPTGLAETMLNDEGRAMVERAIESMLKCAQMAPSCALYSDLAEAYLLYGDLEAAEGYARHATLRANNEDERAPYLAAEICLLRGKKDDARK